MNADDLAERLMLATVRIAKVVDALPETRVGKHVAGQLVRCGTSFAPNYEEARAAESRRDFRHKLGVSLKELRESHWWLKFIIRCPLLPRKRLAGLATETLELVKILSKSAATSKLSSNDPPGRTSRKAQSPNAKSPMPNAQ
jgi:four helix bundle protein